MNPFMSSDPSRRICIRAISDRSAQDASSSSSSSSVSFVANGMLAKARLRSFLSRASRTSSTSSTSSTSTETAPTPSPIIPAALASPVPFAAQRGMVGGNIYAYPWTSHDGHPLLKEFYSAQHTAQQSAQPGVHLSTDESIVRTRTRLSNNQNTPSSPMDLSEAARLAARRLAEHFGSSSVSASQSASLPTSLSDHSARFRFSRPLEPAPPSAPRAAKHTPKTPRFRQEAKKAIKTNESNKSSELQGASCGGRTSTLKPKRGKYTRSCVQCASAKGRPKCSGAATVANPTPCDRCADLGMECLPNLKSAREALLLLRQKEKCASTLQQQPEQQSTFSLKRKGGSGSLGSLGSASASATASGSGSGLGARVGGQGGNLRLSSAISPAFLNGGVSKKIKTSADTSANAYSRSHSSYAHSGVASPLRLSARLD